MMLKTQVPPPYKDKMGRWRTKSLFKEFYLNEELPVFTLKEADDTCNKTGALLPSMRQVFLSFKDPTGYQFAKEVLGSYEHWKKLSRVSWFRQHLEDWLEELETKLRSEGLEKIKEIAVGETGQAYQAAKFLANEDWKDKKGRPKKADIERKIREHAGIESEIEDDYERLRLVK